MNCSCPCAWHNYDHLPEGINIHKKYCRYRFRDIFHSLILYLTLVELCDAQGQKSNAKDVILANRDALQAFYDAGARYIQIDDVYIAGLSSSDIPFNDGKYNRDYLIDLALRVANGVLEDKQAIKARVAEAAKYVPLEQLCISPQCGFASTHHGNLFTEEQQWDKLRYIVEVSEEIFGE